MDSLFYYLDEREMAFVLIVISTVLRHLFDFASFSTAAHLCCSSCLLFPSSRLQISAAMRLICGDVLQAQRSPCFHGNVPEFHSS